MKLSPDTKDTVVFFGGVVGVMLLTIGWFLGIQPSWPLVVLFGGMLGVPFVSEWDKRRKGEDGRELDEER